MVAPIGHAAIGVSAAGCEVDEAEACTQLRRVLRRRRMMGGRYNDAPSASARPRDRGRMMPGHHPCDAKHHRDANLTLKVWTLINVSRRLQSRLAMPRWSKPAASSLSKLPLGPLKVADVTWMASEATWHRRTASGPRWPYAGAAGGREPTDRQPRRSSIAFSEGSTLLTFVVRVMEIISQ